jgi:hypothetical protein
VTDLRACMAKLGRSHGVEDAFLMYLLPEIGAKKEVEVKANIKLQDPVVSTRLDKLESQLSDFMELVIINASPWATEISMAKKTVEEIYRLLHSSVLHLERQIETVLSQDAEVGNLSYEDHDSHFLIFSTINKIDNVNGSFNMLTKHNNVLAYDRSDHIHKITDTFRTILENILQ